MALTKVQTSGIADDAVTTDKLANAINTERTANTAKVSLADDAVTSAKIADDAVVTASIADNAITNALMADDAVGVAELSATGTASSSTYLRGDNSWATVSTTDTKSFRNLLINGASQIAQRGTASVAANTTCADMSKFDCTTGGGNPSGITMQRVSDGPDGFEYSQKVTMGGSTWTPSAGSICNFYQNIEAQNLAHLEYGTSNAKTLTLSFWVKASVTGEYSVALTNNTGGAPHDNANRNYITSYTISSASTWEKKTVTFTGDTSGTWAKTGTGAGMCPIWDIGSGSNHEASTGSWQAGADFRKASTIKIGDTASSTWQITGIQLEVGSSATDFEHRSYAEELSRCQRYLYRIEGGTYDRWGYAYADATNRARAMIFLPTPLRASPTVTTNNFTVNENSGGTTACNYNNNLDAGLCEITYTHGSGVFTVATMYQSFFYGSGGYLNLSAEL